MPGWVVDWLSQPGWVIATVLVAIAPPWFVRHESTRSRPNLWAPKLWQTWRSLSRRLAVVLLSYLVLISPPAVAWGLGAIVSPLPKDSGGTADAIVILGRGDPMTPGRTELAAALWRQQRAPLIVASGVYDAPRMVKALRAKGVAASAVVGEECSLTTYENALFTAAILFPQGKRTIILVTDAPHLWRSHLIYESFGFTVVPLPSPLSARSSTAQNSLLLQREFWLLARYPLDSAQFGVDQHPWPEAMQKMQRQHCQIAG